MKIDTFGNNTNPVIIMLPGSFYPGSGLEYLYSNMCNDYYIIVPTYNGHYEGSSNFTTRENEATEIKDYLLLNGILHIKMIYGQSMGSEIGLELWRQLTECGVMSDKLFVDGGPMVQSSVQ